jgi:hypothetical protein
MKFEGHRRRAAVLIWGGYVLLLIAWVVANPPFMAPDEHDHYIRALALGSGQIVGAPASYRPSEVPNLTAQQRDWVNGSTASFRLESRHVSPVLRCHWFGDGPFRCSSYSVRGDRVLVKTHFGTYPPLSYVMPGLAARIASNSVRGVRLARAAGAAIAAVFLLFALLASADAGLALAACTLAVTPMVIFVAASVNASSMEIASGFCLSATALRFIRDRCRSRWWIPMGISGAALALSRSTGALWLLVLALLILAVEPRVLRSRRGLLAFAVSGVGFAGYAVWAITQEPHLTPTLSGFSGHLSDAVHGFKREVIRESIGDFGWRSVHLPKPMIVLWLLGVALLVGVAAVNAVRRGRMLLGIAATACLAIPIGFQTLVYAQTGWGPQARYFLPLLVALPLLAGHLLASSSRPRFALPVYLFSVALIPLLQLFAWCINTRQWMVGTQGPLLFLERGTWSPPLGAIPWLSTAALGSTALCVGNLLAARYQELGGRTAGAGAGEGSSPHCVRPNGFRSYLLGGCLCGARKRLGRDR